MKKTLSRALRMISALLVAVMLSPMSLAETWLALSTADLNLREGPGLDYKILRSETADTPLGIIYSEDDIATDARGVDWYMLYDSVFDEVWVSSKNVELLEMVSWYDMMDQHADLSYDPSRLEDYKELYDWYGKPMKEATAALGLENRAYTNGEEPFLCYHEGASIAGWSIVEGFYLTGQGYTLFGVCPGMEAETARSILAKVPSLKEWERRDDELQYEHQIDETSYLNLYLDYMEADFVMYLSLNEDDIVTSISVYSYTG